MFNKRKSTSLVSIILLSVNPLASSALVSVPWGVNTGTSTNATGSTVFNTTNALTWALSSELTEGATIGRSGSQIAIANLGTVSGGLESVTLTFTFDLVSDFQVILGNIKVGEFYDSFSVNPTSVTLSSTPATGGSFHVWDGSSLTSTEGSGAGADAEKSTFLWEGITSVSINMNSNTGPNSLTVFNAQAATSVPEPSLTWFFAGSFLLLMSHRRRI